MDPWLAVPLANLGWVAASKAAAVVWLSLLSSLVTSVRGQGLYTLDMNDKAGEGIYVATFQVLLLASDLGCTSAVVLCRHPDADLMFDCGRVTGTPVTTRC